MAWIPNWFQRAPNWPQWRHDNSKGDADWWAKALLTCAQRYPKVTQAESKEYMIPWRSTRMPGYSWISMNVNGYPCILMPRISIGFKDNTRTPMNIHGYPRRDMHNHLWIPKVINVSHQNHNDRASERARERTAENERADGRTNDRASEQTRYKTSERTRERKAENGDTRAPPFGAVSF